MEIKIIRQPIGIEELRQIALESFIEMVKAVVDVEQEIIALGGELHADEEALLLSEGSKQENLWGINIYPNKSPDEWVEFISLINIRPAAGVKTMEVEDPVIREKITKIVNKLIK